MILCIDAGNTRLKWGIHAEGMRGGRGWRAQGTLGHADSPQLATLLPEKPERILACNVAGTAIAAHVESLAATLAIPVKWFRSDAAACGVTNGYGNPQQLGADRWAALIGARSRHAGNALVVMAGTATTIDVLDANGVFRGGLILPGLELMRTSLARNTAGLPEAHGIYCDIPVNTDDAIVSGAMHATLGAIERMARHVTHTNDFLVLLSGGAAPDLVTHLTLPLLQVDNLVLEGLAHFAAGSVW